MAEWPSTLPPPQKRISLTPGDTRKIRDTVSGRKEIRRMGSGAPDQIRVLFRLTSAQWTIFKHLHEWDFNLGLNWFTASWLSTLGYTAHKARFLGYPREVARQQYYVDVVATLLVQATVDIVGGDTVWPCATTGGEPPSPTNGILVGYDYSTTMPTIPPGITCERVKAVRTTIVYMNSGSLHGIGVVSGLPGYDSLGGVVDFCFVDYRAMVYLLDDGTVGALGSTANYFGISTIPSFPDAVEEIQGGNGWVAARCANGAVVAWGRNKSGFGVTDTTNVAKMSVGNGNLVCIKNDGSISVSGSNSKGLISEKPSVSTAFAIVCGNGWALCITTDLIGHYWGWDAGDLSPGHPTGLNPKMLTAFGAWDYNACFALHSNDVLISWGPCAPTIPAGTKCLQIDSPTVKYSWPYVVGILL